MSLRIIWWRFKQNKIALASLIVLFVLIIMALIGPYLNSWGYSEQVLQKTNQRPGIEYWFGTDSLGRDLFTRLWYGARVSILIGIVTSAVSVSMGTLYGSISAVLGGKIDEVMMRIVEVFYAVPFLLYVILLMLIMEPGIKTIIIALATVCWFNTARVVRGQVLKLKEEEFFLAARLLGAGKIRLIVHHILPNVTGHIIVMFVVVVSEAVFVEAFLSFLGLGVSVPKASLGILAKEGIQGIRSYPWQLFFPAVFISLLMLSLNLIGDGLRDALDPKIAVKKRAEL
ncbi:MAG: ABC transporter permease [Bacillota bacterium]